MEKSLMMKQSNLPEAYAMAHLPSKVCLAVTQKPDGNFNLITLEWFMRTSIQPPMFAISVGHSRYSHECLQDVRYFNLVFPSPSLKSLLSLSGSQSGRDIDKFTAGEVNWFPGKLHKLPILSDAIACFECEIVTQVKSGDHTIFVGEVKYSWKDEEKELFYYH
jgi:flavin reductase (DIM6/NTAB) family NADH-FMN oxidoreductase RutF